MFNITLRIMGLAAIAVACLHGGNLFAVTVVVGPSTCQPSFVHFSSIQTAVSSVPPGTTVLVCPGTYGEQVHITQPLTLRGIMNGNSDQAVIVPPVGGLTTNAVDEFGTSLALQLWVDNASGGPVNISNIIVDGTGNGVTTCQPVILGIFYENSAGTANHVTIRNQIGNGCGEGFLAEGGGASPTVTIQNSTVHNVDTGIYTQNQVTANMKANDLDLSGSTSGFGMVLDAGSNNTVSGNVVISSHQGIQVKSGASGSVSSNTVMNAPFAIVTSADGVSVTSNKLFNSSSTGIDLFTSVAAIKTNSITNSNVGIELNCFGNPNVINNTINEAQTGIDAVPIGLSLPNTYFNVQFARVGC